MRMSLHENFGLKYSYLSYKMYWILGKLKVNGKNVGGFVEYDVIV